VVESGIKWYTLNYSAQIGRIVHLSKTGIRLELLWSLRLVDIE